MFMKMISNYINQFQEALYDQELEDMKYGTAAINQHGDVVSEYFKVGDDLSDGAVKVYPVYIPKDSIEKEISTIPDSNQDHTVPPHNLYISKLGEQSPTFSGKPSNHPPVFQPEYIEHSPVFYYAQDTIGVSDAHDDLFHIKTINDENHSTDRDIINNVRDIDVFSDKTKDSEFLSTNSVSGEEIEYYTDVSNILSCSPQSCLYNPNQSCCSPHTARKRQTSLLHHQLDHNHQDVDHDVHQGAHGHDRVTATVTRTMKSVSW